MRKELVFEKLDPFVFVTKLAGFEHSEYIQPNATKVPVDNTDIPMVQGKNIREGVFVEKYDWYISKKIANLLPRSILNRKCILIPYVGSNLGEVGLFPNKYRCQLASNIAKLELKTDKYDLEYVMYYLQSPIGQSYLFQEKQGSSQPNITMESIRNTQIIKKDILEQKKIVKILSLLTKKIERNNCINDNLQQVIKSCFDFMFATRKPNGIISDILQEHPKSTIQVNDSTGILGDYPFFTSGGAINEWQSALVDGMNCYLSTGGNATIKGYYGKAAYSTDTWCVCGKGEYSFYLFCYLKSIIRSINDSFFAGSGLKHLQKDSLLLVNLYIPSEKELEKFNSIVKPAMETMTTLFLETKKLKQQRDFLLPLLMNGQATIAE